MTDIDALVEKVARAIYEDRNRNMLNICDWDSSALDDEYPGYRDQIEREARAALSALPPAVPDGWKLVPAEPTFEMSAAAYDAVDANKEIDAAIGPLETITIYRAMIAAAPEPKP